ncbi:MAG: sn-glycerol-3-phosphate ABC transporter ATP-binding protein UgpC [Acholeplasmatales bacterium]|jgi:multiple sugar transport system ATP-binding protein|nr:sn-glycerol-3-phosphate ABC transporter ATP-binding protein UgpC [Acholeplasmatales bacterium]
MKITLKNVSKIYANNLEVVHDFNLEINDKEFIVFVGPSGCGKSTTLRMIAGLESITEGVILFDDKVINNVLPGNRNIAMVFQSYALYPHMTVYQNMEFSLKLNKIPKEIRDERIKKASLLLGLDEYLDRKPKNLSGGERQRVAVGREIVRDVNVFLMDEPLSNLDAKLRVQMRAEIIKLHKEIKKTFIYVTHDQVEAMTMATRIVIMKDGVIQQIGTPKEVYEKPCNLFVAGFIGTPGTNFIAGKVGLDGFFYNDAIKILIPKSKVSELTRNNYIEKELILGIRPEDIYLDDELINKYYQSTVEIKVDVSELLGYEYNLLFKIGDDNLVSKSKAIKIINADDNVRIYLDLEKCHFFDIDTSNLIV